MSVAISGGTGGLCCELVKVFATQGTHEVVVFTRKVSGRPGGAAPNIHFVAVDYSNIDSLVSVLERYNVDTVISTVNNITGENHAELNLIAATERSKTTRRFITSYSGVPYLPEYGFSTLPPYPADSPV
ncbi:hypothetical protein CORC01_00628 [Colletotrichum orchidophilum]|uniref:NAD(P)-binding domain-containing protein n=1 Tax=Colletotrichum orchidophilum TaxID=1209926 RepID=A0A1G4BS97_9PEZI|nr:uncharacterized protein CORC01_00628 [Colletotrichum orchidophilum]OHF04289.1 hypothetical protein CORC01_00628 [Colletotrichum orchidophilum]